MTEKFKIKNHFTGAVQFTAEIECGATATPNIKLGLAVRWGFSQKADLGGADLRGADLGGAYLRGADLGGAYLRGADLGGADLGGAYLRGADLGGADLGGAYLRGADLGGADLRGADLGGEKIIRLVAHVTRLIESYEFFAFELEAGGVKIKAGCRWFSIKGFRAHVAAEYPDTPKAEETLAILAFIEARAEILEVIK